MISRPRRAVPRTTAPASVAYAAIAVLAAGVIGSPVAARDPAGGDSRPAEGAAAPFSRVELRRILTLSPLPDPPVDPSNAVADDPRAARFGRELFFDKRLSADGTRSCATCHDPERDWSDGARTSDPDARFPKNVPSLWNSAYNRWYFWDGRADSAWSQALGPLESESEMRSDRLRLIHLVRRDAALRATYGEVFGPLPPALNDPARFPPRARPIPQEPEDALHQAWASMTDADRHTANVIFTNLGKALAAFERLILVRDTPFDRFVAALRRGDAGASRLLSEPQLRGLKLFVGRGGCTLCHSGPNLSDGEFHDLGIALGSNLRIDPGRHSAVLKLLTSPFTRAGPYADAKPAPVPIDFLEQRGHQLGQFKTPSLRNVAKTAPYMHDGRFDTLAEVIRFYSTREGALPLAHPTGLLKPLALSEDEIADMVAFLEALSGSDGGPRLPP